MVDTRKLGIVVVTYGKSPFLHDCLCALRNVRYPLYVHYNTPEKNLYEYGGIARGLELKLDEFFVLPDSVIVKDPALFDLAFDVVGRVVSVFPEFISMTGKFTRESLEQYVLSPPDGSKASAIKVENRLRWDYTPKHNPLVLFPQLNDGNVREFAYGRMNMVVENEYLKKYKGCWSLEMIGDYEKNVAEVWR